MKFKYWLENNELEVTSLGSFFKTGVPVTFKYSRNKEKAGYFGKQYQQDIEPHGRYVIQQYVDDENLPKTWESGTITFKNPLVIPFNTIHGNTYDENSWKFQLSRRFGGKKGLNLSKAIAKAGYDGIVAVSVGPDGKPYDTSEIVDLRWLHTN